MKSSKPRRETLDTLYRRRYETALKPLAKALTDHIVDCFKEQPRIDRITARAKGVGSFLEKAKTRVENRSKYTEPLDQIQDQLGARVITFFRSDVERLDAIVKKYFRAIEFRDRVPDSEWEFGYFGRHYVLVVPSEIIDASIDDALIPAFFELQIKTLFQHAWSEADHDLGYKPGLSPLTPSEKRRLAYTSAQAWGADHMFDELFCERNAARLATEK
jgi:putative GTP pyrophosphokinase